MARGLVERSAVDHSSVVGAQVTSHGVQYRVWAPDHPEVGVVLADGRELRLDPADGGFFSGSDTAGRAGDRYRFSVGDALLPDPASRFQPDGVEGVSEVIEPNRFEWRSTWTRPPLRGRVIYELHVGAFTPEGTFRAAIERLDALAELGVNAIELMPVADFAGRWNWGYDGVMLFAPARCYGRPDDLRALVDAAHARGLAVIVDVVYNHFGPCGNVVHRFARDYFHPERGSIWGQGINFDGAHSAPVRAFFLQNARMWFDEYRVDGLRLDAVHAIHDRSEPHIIAEIAALADARGAFVIAEDERNDAGIISDSGQQGWGAHGMWADDFHHSVRVALTGQTEAHFLNYRGTIDEWVETLRHGWLYRGQPYRSWDRPRGSSAQHLPPERFVYCISNHDQVGNRPLGDRLHEVISPGAYRAVSMLLCLVPYTPMLFMGQEWAAGTPFPFFTDHPGVLGANMRANRLNEFRHYQALYDEDTLARMPDPQAESAFFGAKLRWEERADPAHAGVLALYRDCLRLRAREKIFQSASRRDWRVQKLSESAVGLRWTDPAGDWLLVVSIGGQEGRWLWREPFTEASASRKWEPVLWSNAPVYCAIGSAPGAADEVYFSLENGAPGSFLLRER